MSITLKPLPEKLSVAQLPQGATFLPELLSGAVLSAVIYTADETTLICPEAYLPASAKQEKGWRALKILGVLDFSLVGILAGIAGALANAGISIFVLSTFNTDYILIKEDRLDSALDVLLKAGYTIVE